MQTSWGALALLDTDWGHASKSMGQVDICNLSVTRLSRYAASRLKAWAGIYLAVVSNTVSVGEKPPLAVVCSHQEAAAGRGVLPQALPRKREIWLCVHAVYLDNCVHAGILRRNFT